MIIVLESPNVGLAALARGLGAELVKVDVVDMRSVRAAVEKYRPSAVVSTVWRDWREAEEDPEAAFRYNGEAAINMAAAALEFEAKACLISTAAVFGPGGPYDEDAEPRPASQFGEAARRAEIFFARALRGTGLVVRSGPWFETIAHEIRHGLPAPSGGRLQPVGAEALGRYVGDRIAEGATGVAHAVPESGSEPTIDVYRAAAQRMGRAVVGTTDAPLGGAELATTRGATVVEVGADSGADDEAEPAIEDGAVIVDHGGARLLRFAGSPGDAVELSLPGRRVSLWLREGKGLVEQAGEDDRLLGPQAVLTVDGTGPLRFAPATAFDLFVLSSPAEDDAADDAAAADARRDPETDA